MQLSPLKQTVIHIFMYYHVSQINELYAWEFPITTRPPSIQIDIKCDLGIVFRIVVFLCQSFIQVHRVKRDFGVVSVLLLLLILLLLLLVVVVVVVVTVVVVVVFVVAAVVVCECMCIVTNKKYVKGTCFRIAVYIWMSPLCMYIWI